MADYHELLSHIEIPRFIKVRYHIANEKLSDIPAEVHKALESAGVLNMVHSGMRIAVTAGSRQMKNYPEILKILIDEVKAKGAEVFLVPAMGSHGGATAEGQKAILCQYGITEKTMGVPILATMETVKLGVAEYGKDSSPYESSYADGMEVHMDKYAFEADGIILLNRIKAHTGFCGRIESGLMKMIAIGLGKQHGANICHSGRPEHMSENIRRLASYAIEHSNILFGVGVVENAVHETWQIKAIHAGDLWEEEQKLLVQAKSLMPGIPFKKADVLFVDEIGKDITGEGMDPNITGRSFYIGDKEPFFESIAVLDITDASEGNGTGIGNADVISRRAFDKFRMDTVYPNCITSRDSRTTKIPVTMPCDRLAFQFALQICYGVDPSLGPRIVWIKNTLRLDTFYISEALLEEAGKNPQIEILNLPEAVIFDEGGDVRGHDYN